MGIYVNPRNVAFRRALNGDIYIDKTDLITHVNERIGKPDCFLCVSRPRRFGKSMAADMLAAYYSKGCDSAQLFAGKKAEKAQSFRKHLNQYHVIRLDVQRFVETRRDLDTFIGEMESRIVAELARELELPDRGGCVSDQRLKDVLQQSFYETGHGFIFIIDEWDCVFRMAKARKDVQKAYLDFLRGLFKGSEYVELAYLTGILPIKKYGEHSAINIFGEYSMVDPKNLGEYFGFTGEEVQKECQSHGVDYEEVARWYDGYLLGGLHIYNPKSVVDVLTWKKFKSYWTGTETYEALKVYIDMNFDGLKEAVVMMLGGGRCKIDPTTFQNDMTTFKTRDDVLTLLVHLGYLTYDEKDSVVFIPNQEISQEFMRAVKVGGWDGVMDALKRSKELLASTWAMDERAVADGLGKIHSETASMLKYNDENSLTCAILMAYYSAKAYYLNPIMELPTGKGFADVAYLPKPGVDKPALVVEVKWDQNARGAISQIKEKRYGDWVSGYTGEILLVGIGYDKKKKTHQCVIERCDQKERLYQI